MKTQHLSGIVAFLASSAILAFTLEPYTSTAAERAQERAEQQQTESANYDNVTKAFAELSYAGPNPGNIDKANQMLADLGYTDVAVLQSTQSNACLSDANTAISVTGTQEGVLIVAGQAGQCENDTENNPAVFVRFTEGEVVVQNSLDQSQVLAASAEKNILSYQPQQQPQPEPDPNAGIDKVTRAANKLHKRLNVWKKQEGTYIATLKGLNENIKVPKNHTVAQYKSFAVGNKSRQAYLACVVGPQGAWVVYDSTTQGVTLSGTGENGTACVQ